MSWAEVSTLNGDFLNAPLDIKMHLADYKMHGKKSYVFQIKDLLHGIYECTYISMNDQDINGEALEYLIKNNKHIGEALIAVFDLERKDVFKTLRAMTAVLNSSTAMTAVLNSSTAMTAVLNSSTAMTAVANSSTAMTAVANSSTAMTAITNSETAIFSIVGAQYTNIKPFILKINENKEYIKRLFGLIQNSSHFKLLHNGDVGVVVNTYINKQNIITFSCLGYSGSSSDSSGVSSRVYNNGELIKDAIDAGYTSKSTVDKANAVTIGKTHWGYNSGRYNYANITSAVYEKIA